MSRDYDWEDDAEEAYIKYIEDCKKAELSIEELEAHRKKLRRELKFKMFWWKVGWHIDWLLLPVSIPILILSIYLINTGYFQ